MDVLVQSCYSNYSVSFFHITTTASIGWMMSITGGTILLISEEELREEESVAGDDNKSSFTQSTFNMANILMVRYDLGKSDL